MGAAALFLSAILLPLGLAGAERVAINTPYGRITMKLLHYNAPVAAAAVLKLAQEGGCATGCAFYRAERKPQARRGEPADGPPYSLVQGRLQLDVAFQSSEGSTPITEGSVAFIPNSSDFFISLGDHPGWGSTMSVFAEVEDYVSLYLIAVQPVHNVTHEKHGTVMRMMNDEVTFSLEVLPELPTAKRLSK